VFKIKRISKTKYEKIMRGFCKVLRENNVKGEINIRLNKAKFDFIQGSYQIDPFINIPIYYEDYNIFIRLVGINSIVQK